MTQREQAAAMIRKLETVPAPSIQPACLTYWRILATTPDHAPNGRDNAAFNPLISAINSDIHFYEVVNP